MCVSFYPVSVCVRILSVVLTLDGVCSEIDVGLAAERAQERTNGGSGGGNNVDGLHLDVGM